MRYGKGRGQGDNNLGEKNGPIIPKLMRLLEKHTYTSNGPYPSLEKVSRAIRKKRSQYMCKAQRASNGHIYQ